jgi:hypothetical protein
MSFVNSISGHLFQRNEKLLCEPVPVSEKTLMDHTPIGKKIQVKKEAHRLVSFVLVGSFPLFHASWKRARIFKLLRSPRIDSKEPISPVSGRPTTLSYSVPSPHRLFTNSSTVKFCTRDIEKRMSKREKRKRAMHMHSDLYSVMGKGSIKFKKDDSKNCVSLLV